MLDDQIIALTKAYEDQLLLNNNKIYKLKTYNETCQNMINLKVKLLEMDNEIELLTHESEEWKNHIKRLEKNK